MRETAVREFLQQYSGQTIEYYPNPGNAGDALIREATFALCKELDITLVTSAWNTWVCRRLPFTLGMSVLRPKQTIALVPGGGNLIHLYNSMRRVLWKIPHRYKHVIVLPHTIGFNEQIPLLQQLRPNVTIFCREKTSYSFVKQHWPHAMHNLHLDHDLAFSLDYTKWKQEGSGTLQCFREDDEKTQTIPPGNNDIAAMGDENLPITELLSTIQPYKEIHTNRLHIAIAAAHLDKNVHFYPNSYWKNKAVYEYSLNNRFENVQFHE